MIESGLVSVVIPVYNGSRTVRQAIDSALSQSYPHIEVIAINDGSSDDSLEILDSYGDAILRIDQPNAGVAKARNAGIRSSKGEFVAFLDQDDFFSKDKVEQQIKLCVDNTAVGLVHTQVQYVEVETGRFLPLLNPKAGTEQIVGSCKSRLLLGNGMYNSSVLVKRSVLDAVGLCSEEICGNSVQDYDLWIRCSAICEFACVTSAVTYLGIHAEQGLWNRKVMLAEEASMLLRHMSLEAWKKWPQGRARLSSLYGELGVAYFDAGDLQRARKAFLQAWKLKGCRQNLQRLVASYLPYVVVQKLRGSST